MNIIIAIDNKIKNRNIYLFLYCFLVIVGVILMTVYSSSDKVNYIYNEF